MRSLRFCGNPSSHWQSLLLEMGGVAIYEVSNVETWYLEEPYLLA